MSATRDGLPLLVETRPLDRARVQMTVAGELDIATSPYLREDLRRELEAGHGVDLDLSGLRFMDSTGISVLVQAVDEFGAAECSLELSPELSDQVTRLLSMVGMLSRLPFRDLQAPSDR
jgi:anti-sigma B factor antagonist